MDETCPFCTGGGGRPPRPPRAAAPRSGWRPLGRGPQRQAAGLRWSAPRPPPPDCRAQRAWCFCRPSPRGASPRRWLGLPDRVADEHAADEAPGRQHQGRRAGGGGRLRGLNKTGRWRGRTKVGMQGAGGRRVYGTAARAVAASVGGRPALPPGRRCGSSGASPGRPPVRRRPVRVRRHDHLLSNAGQRLRVSPGVGVLRRQRFRPPPLVLSGHAASFTPY